MRFSSSQELLHFLPCQRRDLQPVVCLVLEEASHPSSRILERVPVVDRAGVEFPNGRHGELDAALAEVLGPHLRNQALQILPTDLRGRRGAKEGVRESAEQSPIPVLRTRTTVDLGVGL